MGWSCSCQDIIRWNGVLTRRLLKSSVVENSKKAHVIQLRFMSGWQCKKYLPVTDAASTSKPDPRTEFYICKLTRCRALQPA